MCSNHFKCRSTTDYIAITKQCDGVVDCLDFSDECTDNCGDEIVVGYPLKILSWTMGALALVLNTITIARFSSSVKKWTTSKGLLNKSLIAMIAVGDLIVGLYLVLISIADFIYGKSYCMSQAEWLTSTSCSSLGVLSTMGSQISLFSMTILSFNKLYRFK